MTKILYILLSLILSYHTMIISQIMFQYHPYRKNVCHYLAGDMGGREGAEISDKQGQGREGE